MASSMKFAREYLSRSMDSGVELLPNLYVNVKSRLCLKSKKVDYEDFTKMVKCGESYIPLVCCDSVGQDDIVVDMFPVLNAGAAEMLVSVSGDPDFWDLRFIDWLNDNMQIESWENALALVSEWASQAKYDNQTVLLLDSLRSSLVDRRFPTVKKIYVLLSAIRVINPRFYCIAIVELLKLSYFYSPLLVKNKKAIGCKEQGERCIVPDGFYASRRTGFNAIVGKSNRDGYKPGAISYYSDEGRRCNITDCRGLGDSLLSIFAVHIFRSFGDSAGVGAEDDELLRCLEAHFVSCLGDDFVGTFMKNGTNKVSVASEFVLDLCREANIVPVDCEEGLHIYGFPLFRGISDYAILSRQAIGFKRKDKFRTIPYLYTGYGTHEDVIMQCNSLLAHKIPQIISETDKKARADATSKVSLDRLVAPYKRELELKHSKEVSTLRGELDSANAQVELLRGSLQSARWECEDKQAIIDQLRIQMADLQSQIRSMYSEEEAEDDVLEEESEVSAEEMLAFVNQFRLVIVGGIDTMSERLEQLGFTNVFFVPSVQITNNTPVSGDFFCICTKFVSHKLSNAVESIYSSQLNQFFWFNGTNAESLLKSYYQFVKKWFDAGSEG